MFVIFFFISKIFNIFIILSYIHYTNKKETKKFHKNKNIYFLQ